MTLSGNIARLVYDKGFGFIRADGDQFVEFFFHKNAMNDGTAFTALRPGQRVVFETEASLKGPRARSVTLA